MSNDSHSSSALALSEALAWRRPIAPISISHGIQGWNAQEHERIHAQPVIREAG